MEGQRSATTPEVWVTVLLSSMLVGGLYADGRAHVHVPGLETFFTPWHGVLYGSFVLLSGWLALMLLRRTSAAQLRHVVPAGYGWGWVGIALFAAGGVADLGWHVAFGIEAGVAALLSPTHLVLLAGGLLLVTSPLRAWPRDDRDPLRVWAGVLSLVMATSLTAFFLSYVSPFIDPGAEVALVDVPEGSPDHRVAELPAEAGLAAYLVTTALLVVPLLHLTRRGRVPVGATTLLVAAVAVPAAALDSLAGLVPALGAVAGAATADLALLVARRHRPRLPDVAVAAAVPLLVWTGQLAGLGGSGRLAWPPELWAGVVALATMLSAAATLLNRPAPFRAAHHHDQQPTDDLASAGVRRTS